MRSLSILLTLVLFVLPASPRAAGSVLPDTEQGRRLAGWLAAYNSNDLATLQAYLEANFAPAALAERPAAARAERHRAIHADLGKLEAVAVESGGPETATLVCRSTEGAEVRLDFRFDHAPPHLVLGFGLQVEGPGGPGGPGAAPLPAPDPTEPATARAIRGALDSLARAGQFSGVVHVARGGRTLVEGAWGLADRTSSRRNTLSTRFNLGSINKVFTQTAIGQLAQQGKLRLEDTIERWVPELPREIASRITVAQLLAHRSGLGDFFGPEFEAADHSTLRTNADFLPFFAGRPLEFEPGTRQRYSNAGYVVLGLIVERVSGEDYHDYVRRHVYGPAGMTSTDSYALDDTVSNRAIGYTRLGAGEGVQDNRFTLPARGSAAGGGWSTVADLGRFVRAIREHKLLDPHWSAWLTGAPAPEGVVRASDATPALGGLGLAGGSPGVNALLDASFDPDWVVIVLANGDPPMAEGIGQQFSRWLSRLPR